MQINNHRLTGVAFDASPNISGMLNPQYIVMHYTAGWEGGSAINTLCSPAAKVSAHLVIDRDGTITQLVPFNRVAWHAGPSKFDGKDGMNNYSIGIEMVNIGYLREKPGVPGVYQLSTGSAWKDVPAKRLEGLDLSIKAANKRIGGGTYIWPAYTKAQIDAAKEAVKAIVATYKIKDITTHEIIDKRGWKTDPGPAFPMGEFKAVIHIGNARNDSLAAKGTFVVTAAALNVRKEPNVNSPIVAILHKGDNVAVEKDLGDWSYVEYEPGKFGYLTDKFIAQAA